MNFKFFKFYYLFNDFDFNLKKLSADFWNEKKARR